MKKKLQIFSFWARPDLGTSRRTRMACTQAYAVTASQARMRHLQAPSPVPRAGQEGLQATVLQRSAFFALQESIRIRCSRLNAACAIQGAIPAAPATHNALVAKLAAIQTR